MSLLLSKLWQNQGLIPSTAAGTIPVMSWAAPLTIFLMLLNTNALAQKCGAYFQLPIEPFISVWQIDPTKIRKPGESFSYGKNLLNRKFKIGFATVHKDAHGNLSLITALKS